MKKPKVKVIQVESPEEIARLFESLGLDVPEGLTEAISRMEDPCGNPLCPCCALKGNDNNAVDRGLAVKAVFDLCTKEELAQAATILFGIAAGAYMEMPPPHDNKIGKGIADMIAMLSKKNDKFAFATTPIKDEEGVAKH